ncbi:MAG: AI-2E family transporter [Patescibacteria group bacterium]|nr:AI-2E family transporter [Patescibacteria group bacterium]
MDFAKIRNILFFSSLGLVTILFLFIIKPFFYPVFWAAVIATLFHTFYARMNKWIGHAGISSIITMAAVIIIIILPLGLLGSLLFNESVDIYTSMNTNGHIKESVQNTLNSIKHNPYTQQLNIDEQFWTEKFAETAQSITNYLFTALKNLTQNSLIFALMFIIMLYTLFFFLRDGEKFLKKAMHLCPLGDKYEKLLYQKFTSTARSALKSTLIVGGIQGALGGLLFWATGIQGALIWSVIMMVFAIIPGVGCAIIWLPAGIILLLTGQLWQGLAVLVFGFLFISTIDNLLRPILIGKDTQMHPLLILFSTLGGVIFFGVSGFVIGPIITALLLSFWEMYDNYFQKELSHNGN